MSEQHYAVRWRRFDQYHGRWRMSDHHYAVCEGRVLITIMFGGGCRITTTLCAEEEF